MNEFAKSKHENQYYIGIALLNALYNVSINKQSNCEIETKLTECMELNK